MGIPIILTNRDNIPPVVKSFISDRNITKTYVIGGTDIISENSAREFSNVERILGWDKYERNLNIIKRFQDSINFSNLYIATGADFPDSLSGSALASITSSPIALMDKNDVTGITDLIKEKSINNVVVLGGEGVVSGAMIDKIQNGPLFKPNDILAFYPPDWNDLTVAKKAHACGRKPAPGGLGDA
jgi:hypothetical protein